jgi:hypothetical protein
MLNPMANTKQVVLKLLEGLPDDASIEDVQYHLYVLQHIQRARKDVAAGRMISQDEVERRSSRDQEWPLRH